MPGAGGAYLPPVIAQLAAQMDDFAARIAEAKAMLLAFSRTDSTARLSANPATLYSNLVAAKVALMNFSKGVSSAKLGADAAPFWAEIVALKAELKAMSPMNINLDADIAGVLAKIEMLRGMLALERVVTGSAGGGGSVLGGAIAGRAGKDSGGMGLGAILAAILWGGGGGLKLGIPGGPGWGGVKIPGAGMGSLASFAGLGGEHILMTLLGLGGSAIGAGLGAGALGLGMMGTSGVGMGSDMMVSKSTIGDTHLLATAYENLAKAQAVYGKGSRQAWVAQQQLNYQIAALGGASKVGVAAEMQLAQATMAFGAVFDSVTQQARASFVNGLALPILKMAQGYLPLIADSANRNFKIIGEAIKPFLAWLSVDGQRIFKKLEDVFAKNLPTSVGILTQTLELLFKTMEHVATSSGFGNFEKTVLAFVTRLNTTGFDHFMAQVDSMIKLFRTWSRFVVALGTDIALMFGQSLGLGKGIIESLTVMLNRLGDWEKSTQGKASMHNIFAAHKDEIIALLQIIPPLVISIGRIYLALAPTLTRAATLIATVLVQVVNFLTGLQGGAGTFASWTLGMGLLLAKLHLLGPVLGGLGGAVRGFGATVSGVFQVMRMAGMSSFMAFGIIGIAILAIIIIGYLLITHWRQIRQVAITIWGWIGPYVHTVLTAIGSFIKGFVAGAKMWWKEHGDQVATVWGVIKTVITVAATVIFAVLKVVFGAMLAHLRIVWDLISGVIRIAWNVIKTIFTVALDLLTGKWGRAWNDLKNGAKEIFASILSLIGNFIGDIIRPFSKIDLFSVGKAIIQGLINGIANMAAGAVKAVQGIVDKIKAIPIIGKLMGSPSPFFTQVGEAIGQGAAIGVTSSGAKAVAAVAAMSRGMRDAALGPSRLGGGLSLAGAGGGGGGGNITVYSSPKIEINGVSSNPQEIGRQLERALDKHTLAIVKALKQGAFAVPGQ